MVSDSKRGRPCDDRCSSTLNWNTTGSAGGTCQPDSDSLLKINVDFVAVSLATGRVGKFTTL